MTGQLIRLVTTAAILVTCGGHGAEAAPTSRTDAEQATATLRAIYQGPNPYGVFKSRDPKVLGKLLTPALVETWAGPEADGPQSDGSPLTWHQMTDSARLVAVEPRGFTGDRGTLEVTVDSVIEDKHVTERIAWNMQRVGGRWLADNSHYAGNGFRAVFAGFAPAAAPATSVPLHAGPRPPLRIGDYKSPSDDNCYGMNYWSNHLGSGIHNGEDGSPIAGWDCLADRYSHSGAVWTLHGSCSTGAGGHIPERKGSLSVRLIDETSFVHSGQLYRWCGPGFSPR